MRAADPSDHCSAAAALAVLPTSRSAAANIPNARDLISPSRPVSMADLLNRTTQPRGAAGRASIRTVTPARLNAREAEKLQVTSGECGGKSGQGEVAGGHSTPKLVGAD